MLCSSPSIGNSPNIARSFYPISPFGVHSQPLWTCVDPKLAKVRPSSLVIKPCLGHHAQILHPPAFATPSLVDVCGVLFTLSNRSLGLVWVEMWFVCIYVVITFLVLPSTITSRVFLFRGNSLLPTNNAKGAKKIFVCNCSFSKRVRGSCLSFSQDKQRWCSTRMISIEENDSSAKSDLIVRHPLMILSFLHFVSLTSSLPKNKKKKKLQKDNLLVITVLHCFITIFPLFVLS